MAKDKDMLPILWDLESIGSAVSSTVAAGTGKDEEIDAILASFRDSDSMCLDVPSSASTSTEITADMAKDAPMDNSLPRVPDVNDQDFPAISGIRGRCGGVDTGTSVEVDKLGPISAPEINSSTSVVSWAEYQPTLTDEFLTIPDIEQGCPIPTSEAPRPIPEESKRRT